MRSSSKTHTLIPRKSNKLKNNKMHNVLLLSRRGQPNNDSRIPSNDIYNYIPLPLLIVTTYLPLVLFSEVSFAFKSVRQIHTIYRELLD